jgi:hypothetical protein
MPKLEIKVPHELTQSEALIRIQKFLPDLKAQHSDRISDLEESWSGSTGQFKFKIKGFKVSGSLFVGVSDVLIKGDIPFLAAPFKGTIEETIKTKATELLGVK